MRIGKLALCAAAIGACVGSASATPLRLDYCVTDLGGGQYHYVFTMTLDNHDNTWAAGQAWRWLIFGDQNGAPSPLTGWVDAGTVWPVGPWTGYSSSGGGHNGPTMNYVLDYWTPNAVGDSLTWQGNANVDLPEAQMLFSTIAGTLGGGIAADFETAHRTCGGPAPCYPNCDNSTTPPILNVLDFGCFLNKFSSGDTYANCDHSTTAPVLNVLDFGCFLNSFAAGCT